MIEKMLTKNDVAKRYSLARQTVNTLCSRSPESLPPFFKLGNAKNSPIRFRLQDCIAFENRQLEKQEMTNRLNTAVDLSSLTG